MINLQPVRLRSLVAAFVATAALATNALAENPASTDQWSFSVTPYLWLPNVDGTLKYQLPQDIGASVGVGPNDFLKNLQTLLMLSGEARKGRWAVLTDIVWLDFSSERSHVSSIDFVQAGQNPVSSSLDSGTRSSLKGAAWTLSGSYRLMDGASGTLDALGGFRYLSLKASTDWNLTASINGPNGSQVFPRSGNVSKHDDLWDAIIGVRGRVALGSGNWSLPYYLDVGTGSSRITWQALAGVAYTFGWGDLTLAYRHLFYDLTDDKLVQDLRFSGPALGGTFRF